MSVNLQPIFTQTVGSGGAASVTFNNIPQTFTDLKVVYSIRTSRSGNNTDQMFINFNSNTSSYTWRWLYSAGGAASGSSATRYAGEGTGASATSNTFSNVEIYIPNYMGSNYKSYLVDSVTESNSSYNYNMSIEAGLWSNTAAITSISLSSETGSTLQQYSTISLYGVLRQGI